MILPSQTYPLLPKLAFEEPSCIIVDLVRLNLMENEYLVSGGQMRKSGGSGMEIFWLCYAMDCQRLLFWSWPYDFAL